MFNTTTCSFQNSGPSVAFIPTQFVCSLVDLMNSSFQNTHLICHVTSENASTSTADGHFEDAVSLQNHSHRDVETKSHQSFCDNLSRHVRGYEKTDQQMALAPPRLVKTANKTTAFELIPEIFHGCEIIAQYKASSQLIPKRVIKDLRSLLKYSTKESWDGHDMTQMLYNRTDQAKIAVYDAIDTQEYHDYLHWEGQWRKCRAPGKYYPKRSLFFASVVSWLLNHNRSIIMPQRNLAISPTPLRILVTGSPMSGKTTIAVKLAAAYRLQVVSLESMYNMYTQAYFERNMGIQEHEIIKDLENYSDIIERRSTNPLSIELNVKLLTHFMIKQQHAVRGYVIDGFPDTVDQIVSFRNAVDNFDTDAVLASHRREHSALLDDPIDPGPPNLPHCLLDLVIDVRVSVDVSFKRLRGMDYSSTMHNYCDVSGVNRRAKLDSQEFTLLEKRVLQWYKEAERERTPLLKSIADRYLDLDGSGPLTEFCNQAERLIIPALQARFDDIVQQPNLNVLEGLTTTEATNESVQTTGDIRDFSDRSNNSESFHLRYITIDLQKERTPHETHKSPSQMTVKTAAAATEKSVEASDTDEDTLDHISPSDERFLEAQADFKAFVYGEGILPEDEPVQKPIEDLKKDGKEKKDKKTERSKKDSDAEKNVNPGSIVTAKKPYRHIDINEFGLPRISKYFRNIDSGNPVVARYNKTFAEPEQHLQIFEHISESPEEENIFDDELSRIEHAVMKKLEEDIGSPEIRDTDMKSYFASKRTLIDYTTLAASDACGYRLERFNLQNRLGTFYDNGFPIIRLQGDRAAPVHPLSVQEPKKFVDLSEIPRIDTHLQTSIMISGTEAQLSTKAVPQTFAIQDSSIVPNRMGAATQPAFGIHQDPNPASSQLKFDLALIYQWMAERWRAVEKEHAAFGKRTFRLLRSVQEDIMFQLEKSKEVYFDLYRSHAIHFQSVLYDWQSSFNSIGLSKRATIQYKELLHSQVQAFRKLLMDDITTARQKDIQLHDEMMRSGWFQDRIAILINYFVGMMQVEIDAFIDGLNLLRDFNTITSSKLIGTQNTPVASVPFIELPGLEKEDGRPTPSLSPTQGENKKSAKADLDKNSFPPGSSIKTLSAEPVFLNFLSRRAFVSEALARTESSSPGKKVQKSDRKSQLSVETSATRKHSRTQAVTNAAKDDLEDLVLKELLEKAKDLVQLLREHEDGIRISNYNVRATEEPKKPTSQKAVPTDKTTKSGATSATSNAIKEPLIVTAKLGQELALEEEAISFITRLESIHTYAALVIGDAKTLAKAVNLQIAMNIEQKYETEVHSVGLLIEYLHCKIENEDSIDKALVFHDNRFCVSPDLWAPQENTEVHAYRPFTEKLTLHKEFLKYHRTENKFVYEDLQKVFIAAVEKGFGKDLIGRVWTTIEPEELYASANLHLKPPSTGSTPDGVDVCEVQLSWKKLLQTFSTEET